MMISHLNDGVYLNPITADLAVLDNGIFQAITGAEPFDLRQATSQELTTLMLGLNKCEYLGPLWETKKVTIENVEWTTVESNRPDYFKLGDQTYVYANVPFVNRQRGVFGDFVGKKTRVTIEVLDA